MKLSVIIPAFDARTSIPACLESLATQGVPTAGESEVFVVDDGSTDGTADLVAAKFPAVTLIRLPQNQGSFAARNAALARSRGAIVAYVDADCAVLPGWAAAALAAVGPERPIVMGRVVPPGGFAARTAALLELGEFVGDRPRDLANFATLNLVVQGDLARAHPFEAKLRNAGDRALSWTLHRQGHRIAFEPAMAVRHDHPARLCDLARRRLRYADAAIAVRAHDPSVPGGRLLRTLGPLAAPIAAAGRLARDLGRLGGARAALGISLAALPLYAAALAGLRAIDGALMAARLFGRTGAVGLLLVALSAGLYANAIHNDFVFDDIQTFRMKTQIESWTTLHKLFTENHYRPIRYLSFALDYAISGDRPWAYHVLNSIYHGLTALAVFALLRRLAGGNGHVALAAALIFAVHPLHTESVAYISGRRDILTALFYLCAFILYLRHRESGRIAPLAGAGACFLLALGAKEMAVTLPAALLLHAALFDREALRRRWPLVAAGLVVSATAAAWAVHRGASSQVGWHGGSAAVNFMTVARIFVHYAQLFVAPTTLLADYSYDAFPLSRSLLEPDTLRAVVAIAAALGAAWACRRRAPLVSFAIAFYFLALMPVAHVIPFHELAAEHHAYLPSVGLCLLAGLGFESLRAASDGRGKWVAWPLLALALVLLGARTVVRNRDWRDAETIHRATIAVAPRCVRARFNLGVVYAQRGELPAAIAQMEEAIRIQPDSIAGRFGLLRVYERAGRIAEAREQAEKGLALAQVQPNPPVPAAYFLGRLGRFVEAANGYAAIVKATPDDRRAWLGLAGVHESLKNHPAALDAYERAIDLRPSDAATIARAYKVALASGDRARAARLRARLDAAPATQLKSAPTDTD